MNNSSTSIPYLNRNNTRSYKGEDVYYYEDKPYGVIFEGKLKVSSVIQAIPPVPRLAINKNILTTLDIDNMNKWIDVVIYEPLYPECEFPICVKEKEDFYKNYLKR